jgi:hypothetical protein
MGKSSEKQGQDMEYLGNGYYKIEINKKNLVSAYESTKSGDLD